MSSFSEKKAIALAKKIIDPINTSSSEKLETIKKRVDKNLWEDVFWIEDILELVYKEKKVLVRSINKGQDLYKSFQMYLDNVLQKYDLKVSFNWLYYHINNNKNISKLENIIKPPQNSKKFDEELRNYKKRKDTLSNDNSMIIPIYNVVRNSTNNIKWYLYVDIKEGDKDKIFFLLNVAFRSLHDIINEIFELKYKEISIKSMFDTLTWAYMRKTFEEILKKDLLDKEKDKDIYVMFIDIDDFSKVNNNFWHSIWDKVLKQFVLWIQKNIRNVDYIWRWWWEEFIVVFNFDKEKIDNKGIEKLLKTRFNKVIKNIQIKDIEWPKNITFSWWIIWTNKIKYDPYKDNIHNVFELLITNADNLMYKAKKSWKNKVIFQNWEKEIIIKNFDE